MPGPCSNPIKNPEVTFQKWCRVHMGNIQKCDKKCSHTTKREWLLATNKLETGKTRFSR